MKRKNIETIVLIVGVAIISIALFFMFARATTPQTIFLTNLVFSFGFLVYIIYSMMATNSLNKEIRGLNKHIQALKQDIVKKNQQIQERDSRIELLEKDLADKEETLTSQAEKVKLLEQELSDLRSREADSNI